MRKTLSPPDVAPAKFTDADGASARYGFSPEHWRRLVDAGKAPQPTRFGRLVRWAIRSLDEWDGDGCPPVRAAKGGAGELRKH